jgi:hypothetical protein
VHPRTPPCTHWQLPPTRQRSEHSGCLGVTRQAIDHRSAPVTFLERLLLHYKVYRGYPLPPWPAFKNAWRIAFR